MIHTRTILGDVLRRRFREAGVNQYACISVSDTGIGMVPDTKSHIFETGFTTKGQSQGTGLGLSMVNSIVTDHHGFIEVTSEPGRGSIFALYLPIPKAANTAALLAPTETHRLDHDKTTILYAEDEARLAELMQRRLEREGFRVLIAKDGLEAVELHNRHKDEIAIAILDSGLAKLNGWDALQQMKKSNPQLKAILASGHIAPETEARVANGELSGVLQKPYVGEEVLTVIKRSIHEV